MRKDVKTGLLIGTIMCIAAVVWFSIHHRVVEQPRMEELLSQKKDLFVIEQPKEQINLSDENSQLPSETAPSVRMHIVTSGQTLSDISKMYYGTTASWRKIYTANKDQLSKGPNAIKAGMKLVIPQ
jgi:nucleoid-associated protein YgaU